jgi:predicted helicase
MASPIGNYIKEIQAALKQGNATEHTHRPALKRLVEGLRPKITATNEPQRIACGAPDFIVTEKSVPLGYIEAKDVGLDLDRAEESQQLKRYRNSLRNLILTDYVEFRLYRNGEIVHSAKLGKWQKNGVIRVEPNGEAKLNTLFQAFFDSELPSIASPRDLAERMARIARLLHDLIRQVFTTEGQTGDLHGQYAAFQKILISDLSVDQFADMYAQTIAYGLFAARCNHVGAGFRRERAGAELPKTNPFLRRLFNNIAGADLDERISWAVDDLSELLARADMTAILADFGHATRQLDPVVHFYETFLAAYDPKLRELRGVYYTPEPVVDYIVRSVDLLLKQDFKLKDGLADSSHVKLKRPKVGRKGEESYETHRVQIIDPACGTGTFLHSIIASIHDRFADNAGMWPSYVANHLLPRVYGFEILMAPYAVAHMKLGLQLKETKYDFGADERLRVFLTNTLEEAHEMTGLPLFTQWLADEAAAAGDIKKNVPIMVVIGNPPYSGHSANKGGWINDLLGSYKKSPELKKPAQAKWLSDDYVKFIRFAQWRIEQTGYGVLAFITNHSYLDNPTFLDMRASLMATFDDMYLLDLHGNSKKKERAPKGQKDENVFDIQQGVAIALLVKRSARSTSHRVYRADLWGTRDKKYGWLLDHDVTNTGWEDITPPKSPWLFVKQDAGLLAAYQQGWSVAEIFGKNGDPAPGFATQHDEFAISFTAAEAAAKVKALLATSNEEEARELFSLCAQSQWTYVRAKAELPKLNVKAATISVTYRPFDNRFSVYNRNVLVHRRERVSSHLSHPNVALCIPKNQESTGTTELDGVFCVDRPVELNLFRRGGAFVLPLWLYPGEEPELLNYGKNGRQPNLADDFVSALGKKLGGSSPTPEHIFAYIYAVLYSPNFRRRYADFLRRDFPRIPLPQDASKFKRIAVLGQRLVDLHLLRQAGRAIAKYPIAGSNRIDNVQFKANPKDADVGRVYINSDQYFAGVPKAVWDYTIGGYPVVQTWLKQRKSRENPLLTFDELQHCSNVIAALNDTIAVQSEIDKVL